MKHLFYPLACGLLLFGGCKDTPKEEPRFDATGTYTITTVPVAGAVRMFTMAGEVHNAQLIRNFSQRNYPGLFYSPGFISPYVSGELAFDGKGKATLTTSALLLGGLVTTTLDYDVTSQTSDNLLLSRQLSALTNAPVTPDACYNIVRDIEGLPPVFACTALPPASGFSMQCVFKPVYVLNLRGTQPSLALMSYIFSATKAGRTCSFAYRNDFNVFNTTLPGRLNAGDTLVVQEAELPLVKK